MLVIILLIGLDVAVLSRYGSVTHWLSHILRTNNVTYRFIHMASYGWLAKFVAVCDECGSHCDSFVKRPLIRRRS